MYKRQAIGYVSSTGHVVQTQPVREGIYTISTLVPGLSYLGVFLVPVSYTHLDVYKRQPLGELQPSHWPAAYPKEELERFGR